MSQKTNQSPLDNHRQLIEELLAQGKSKTEIATILTKSGTRTTRKSITRAMERWGVSSPPILERVGVTVQGDNAEVVSKPSPELNDPNTIIRERGLDPEEWLMSGITVNEWDAPSIAGPQPMRQLKVQLKRKNAFSLPQPARIPSDYVRPNPRPVNKDKPRLVVLLGDQHAPHQDPDLHKAVRLWLEENQPEEGVLLGDLVDFPEISRHRFDPAWQASTQTCIDAGYGIIRDYVRSSPKTTWAMCGGNHEARLRNTIIDQARDLYGLRPGGDEDLEPVLGLSNLLRLDELKIRYVHTETTYEHAKVHLCKNLAAIHGHIATKHSGTSAIKTLEQYAHSVVQGHSHRASIIFRTVYDINGKPETLTAAEAGCLCKIRGGLGYTVNPDWTQGFCTAMIYPDGTFKLDLATYVNGKLYWGSKTY